MNQVINQIIQMLINEWKENKIFEIMYTFILLQHYNTVS